MFREMLKRFSQRRIQMHQSGRIPCACDSIHLLCCAFEHLERNPPSPLIGTAGQGFFVKHVTSGWCLGHV
jgi:hypothetical protein